MHIMIDAFYLTKKSILRHTNYSLTSKHIVYIALHETPNHYASKSGIGSLLPSMQPDG